MYFHLHTLICLSYDVDEVGVRQHVTPAAQFSEAEVIQHLSDVVVGENVVKETGFVDVPRVYGSGAPLPKSTITFQ